MLLLILPSVKFRVNPWQMLLLVLLSVFCFCLFRVIPCSSVANAYSCSSFRVLLLLVLPSVKFRVNPWQMLLLGFPLFLPSVASASAAFCLLSRH